MKNRDYMNGCGFSEKLVSYLYDELEETERKEFEEHLQACELCSDELRAFDEVRFAVSEWRQSDFEHLTTPKVELPRSYTREFLSVLNDFWEKLLIRRWIVLVSACLLIILGLVLFTKQDEEIVFSDQKGQSELASAKNPTKESAATVRDELVEREIIADSDETSSQNKDAEIITKKQDEAKIRLKSQPRKREIKLNKTKPVEKENLIDLPYFQEEKIRLVDIFDEVGGI